MSKVKKSNANPSTIQFAVNNTNKGLWNTLKKNEYDDCLQPLLELIDNAFASASTTIKITLDFEKNIGSIEDNGKGFGNDPDELSRCFTYGPDIPKQTDLNEHGCGMKSSLAILDPTDSTWSVTWKCDSMIYQVSAPYSKAGLFQAINIEVWPGAIQGPSGSIIKFPFHKENLGSLYEKQDKASFARVIPKLVNELSHRWMFFEAFMSGRTELFLNDKKVIPYIMPTADTEYVSKSNVNNFTFDNGAKIHMIQYTIEKSLPNSDWFRKSTSCNGVYIFKNGRAIAKVNSGTEYRKILGVVPDNHHNGMIILVNITGAAHTLPITVPTKNRFKASNNPNYEQMVKYINQKVILPSVENPSEEHLLSKFEKARCNIFKATRVKHEFLVEREIKFEDDKFSTPKLDAIETINTDIYIYEAKKDNKVSLQHIIQMFGNFILATSALQQKNKNDIIPTPVILINADTMYKLPDTLKNTIMELSNNSVLKFPVEIWNYNAEVLFPQP
uniref:Uncharacterized protein n=1 Tax=viral metagenome TaxID=1070528 RepID=A0A6C0DJU0_9ZZZZ